MKKSGYKFILILYSFLFILSALIILVGAGLVFNIITIVDSNGNRVISYWPSQYTSDFVNYFEFDNDIPEVSQTGIQSLDDNHLWLQVLDENGNAVFAQNTTNAQPVHYSPIDFLELNQNRDKWHETVYAGTVAINAEQWTYIIGFPMNITKVMMYFDGDSFINGKSLILILIAVSILLILAGGGISGVCIVKHMRKMTQSIGQISHRRYTTIQSKGPFQDIYNSLNEMNNELLESDKALARNEKSREEWIANITHDLKTPLAPIKGYAELLTDSDNSLPIGRRIRYGQTMLRNIEYAEKLVDDLKLTYQLKNAMLPLDKRRANLAWFVREIIIEILNNPEYSDRVLVFNVEADEILFYFDKTLLKRALNNLIYNALIHNPKDTQIKIAIQKKDKIVIVIEDNGGGIDADKMDSLFKRYYRGTSTENGSKGTGLGMAIAKQIIEMHDGSLAVNSELGQGTKTTICFPRTN